MANVRDVRPETPSTYLDVQKRKFHYLKHPCSFTTAMAWTNLAYQMCYSIELLEQQLADEGTPHLLQLELEGTNSNPKTPTAWSLYADGQRIVSGSGAFAQQCFETTAETFLETCRTALETSGLPALSASEYRLYTRCRAIARVECQRAQ